MKYRALLLISLISIIMVLSVSVRVVSAQAPSNYYVTVEPDFLPNALQYWSIGRIVALSFKALWTYGPDCEKGIQNATASIDVTDQNNKAVDTLSINTGNGTFSFNYTSKDPVILAFTPTKLVTQDGQEWNSSLIDSANNVHGFSCHWMQVWWDMFHVSIVSYNTNSLGNVAISVNVTHLLLPEEGLLVGPVFVPKIVNGANVTINGIKADESQTAGIYSANLPALPSTRYVNVEVSEDYWATTSTGFSLAADTTNKELTQTSLSRIIIATIIVLVLFVSVFLLIHFRKNRKTQNL